MLTCISTMFFSISLIVGVIALIMNLWNFYKLWELDYSINVAKNLKDTK